MKLIRVLSRDISIGHRMHITSNFRAGFRGWGWGGGSAVILPCCHDSYPKSVWPRYDETKLDPCPGRPFMCNILSCVSRDIYLVWVEECGCLPQACWCMRALGCVCDRETPAVSSLCATLTGCRLWPLCLPSRLSFLFSCSRIFFLLWSPQRV